MFLQSDSQSETDKPKKPLSPPRNRFDWLRRHGLKKWPMDGKKKNAKPPPTANSVIGDLEQIKQDLQDHAGWDDAFLNDVDSRLTALEGKLSEASERFMCELTDDEEDRIGLRMIDIKKARGFCDPEVMQTMGKTETARKSIDTDEGKKVEEAVFLGFLPGGLAPLLPGKVETLRLLDLVTSLQNFSPPFLKFWKKIAFSDESTSFVQLCFWWLWLERYKKKSSAEQSEIFTKMAANFTELVMKTSGKKKDEFFLKYPSFVSQAIYSTFCQAFPHSIRQFYSKDFRQWLCNNIYELISGIPCPVECWNQWSMKDLDPLYTAETAKPPPKQRFDLSVSLSESKSVDNGVAVSFSVKQQAEDKKQPLTNTDELPSVGPGPVFESIKFGTTSYTPLLQHQLWVHGLIDTSQLNETRNQHRITRTQIKEPAPPSMTYPELLKVVSTLSRQRYKEYDKEVAGYEAEIRKSIAEFYSNKRELQSEMKRILKHRHEVSIEAEKIMANYDFQSATTGNVENRDNTAAEEQDS